jgi:diadenosine tetraphosphatase ApaH/serine/threonine PP2A family protein phosphatase
MARIRTIKPEFFTSEDIVCMSPLARLFYVALWCESDREGRMEWKPVTFKMRYLPGDTVDISTLAQELIDRGLLVLYQAGDKCLAEIPTFSKHQVINNREAASTLPARDKNAKATRGSRVKAEGKEGKGKEGKDHAYLAGFQRFWNTWPASERKQDKKACAEKWERQGLEDLTDQIVADVEAKKQTQKWREGFIEMPETYINNRRWEDGGSEDSTPWHESRSGIERKAAELGLQPWDEIAEQWPAYKARVMRAAMAETGRKVA